LRIARPLASSLVSGLSCFVQNEYHGETGAVGAGAGQVSVAIE